MFTQHNMLEKIARIIVFALLTYLSQVYVVGQEIAMEDRVRLTIVITCVFLIYETYYPSVRIELEKNA
jgi:hypothetical protein